MPLFVGINMFILWFSWFSMNFSDPLRIALPLWLKVPGLILFVGGIVLAVVSHIHIPGYGTGQLRTTGIYAKIRHPMYFGFMLWLVGFPLFWQSMTTLITAVLWVPAFASWQILEEKQLVEKFPEYREYKKRTWF
jgi:protein-S-isoprenylcysteine O-methyltransferase Ste14